MGVATQCQEQAESEAPNATMQRSENPEVPLDKRWIMPVARVLLILDSHARHVASSLSAATGRVLAKQVCERPLDLGRWVFHKRYPQCRGSIIMNIELT